MYLKNNYNELLKYKNNYNRYCKNKMNLLFSKLITKGKSLTHKSNNERYEKEAIYATGAKTNGRH